MYLYNKRHINGIFYKCIFQPNKMSIANCIFQISKWYRPASGDKLRVSMSMCSYPPGRAAQETLEKNMSKDPIAHKQMWFLNSPHVPGYGMLRSETGLQPFTPFVTWCHVLCFAMRSGRSARRPIFGLATGDNGDSRCRSSMRRSSGTGNPSNNMNST